MPIYTFQCKDCSLEYHPLLSFSDYENYKKCDPDLGVVFCDSCGGTCRPVFDPGDFGATFKEGETGGWASKTIKERALREKRWDHLGRKKKEHVKPQGLVPNYEGQAHDRWTDVQDHVRIKHGDDVAKSYDPFVKKESKPA